MNKSILLFLLAILFISCYQEPDTGEFTTQGLKPIYLTAEEFGAIESQDVKNFDKLGKIVCTGDKIFINEQLKGIHVIDNSDPTDPVTTEFWSIPGNIDFTISNNILYADNSFDLLTIDISNPKAIAVLSRVENIYPNDVALDFPENHFGFFECADRSLGIVIGWEEALLTNPKCSL